RAAVHSPLLEVSADGAKGILFTISGRDDLSMWEVQEAAKLITENVDKEAKIIFGAVKDERLRKGMFKVTVIASGFVNGFARTTPLFSPVEANLAKAPAPKAAEEEPEASPGSEEWDSVPAFLRRSKKI
ncbi:MAG TPA: cell division protein FtsZ, partial [Candidatus Paceibacterota bacterium]